VTRESEWTIWFVCRHVKGCVLYVLISKTVHNGERKESWKTGSKEGKEGRVVDTGKTEGRMCKDSLNYSVWSI